MWMSKVAMIMTIFSFCILWAGYFTDEVSGLSLFTEHVGVDSTGTDDACTNTYCSLDQLINRNTIEDTISVDLIFGDFIAAARVLFGVITGETLAVMISALPNFDFTWQILVNFLFGVTNVFLWAYVIAGRSL